MSRSTSFNTLMTSAEAEGTTDTLEINAQTAEITFTDLISITDMLESRQLTRSAWALGKTFSGRVAPGEKKRDAEEE